MPIFKPEDLASWSGGSWTIGGIPMATGVTLDSRSVQAGDLFVALSGGKVDGHDYAEQALKAGAAGALVCREFAKSHRHLHPLLAVDEVAAGLTGLARGYRTHLSATVIGITGSVGKTTVKELLADMLSRKAPTARTHGNWNNDLGLPLSLLAAEQDVAYGVFEVGMNQPGEIATLSSLLRPHHAVITPIGPAHMEAFSCVQDVANEKADLVRQVSAGGTVVVSRDDTWCDLVSGATEAEVITVSLQEEADLYGLPTERWPGSFTARDRNGGKVQVEVTLPGDYFKLNVLLAAAAACRLGVAWEDIRQAVIDYQPLAMRWAVEQVEGVTVVNDAYNANPMSMRQALLACHELPLDGRRWLVLGSMLELGKNAEQHHAELGETAAEVQDSRVVAVGEWAEVMAAGARAAGMPEDHIAACGSVEEAVDRLSSGVEVGDGILVKASRGARLEHVIEGWKQTWIDTDQEANEN